MDQRTRSWVDQNNAWKAATVRRHGWLVQYVGGEECSRPGSTAPPEMARRSRTPLASSAWGTRSC